jgi:hypothetical protein
VLTFSESDLLIGQLVSLEVVQRSDEMPFLGLVTYRTDQPMR